jgi:5'(3')-deoxyribonucleotidase
LELFEGFRPQIDQVLNELSLEQVFTGNKADFHTWQSSPPEAARLIWDVKTERLKMSSFAEEFFRRLAVEVGGQMLLRKGELHRLIELAAVDTLPAEVAEKLDILKELFEHANRVEEVSAD